MPTSFLKEISVLSSLEEEQIGIAIGNQLGSIHSGLAYKTDDESIPMIIHLGDNEYLLNESIDKREWYSYSVLKLESIQIALLKYCIDKIIERGQKIGDGQYKIDYTYGINFVDASIDPEGVLSLAPGSTGLTCATFVLTVLSSARIYLINKVEWESRDKSNPIDSLVQYNMIHYMISNGRSPDDVQANFANYPCTRYRPEEVTAASSHSLYPAPFSYCEPLGKAIVPFLKPFPRKH